jgi:hypothetical protein
MTTIHKGLTLTDCILTVTLQKGGLGPATAVSDQLGIYYARNEDSTVKRININADVIAYMSRPISKTKHGLDTGFSQSTKRDFVSDAKDTANLLARRIHDMAHGQFLGQFPEAYHNSLLSWELVDVNTGVGIECMWLEDRYVIAYIQPTQPEISEPAHAKQTLDAPAEQATEQQEDEVYRVPYQRFEVKYKIDLKTLKPIAG